ncbi:hypothetical protein DICPUDRAFT_76470 [Dictyostelium purpureum]|uniref:Uncharacterized protein n=1 Tax=Dictyostelium purpureum TaxID=5786 RepID=F0ZDQ1_DICPU|nr:uncharacterized protein DICPUDRAFT_76470 [Dictyostelium purpureum]EGC37974.1 hypothetical protein DICPUDRAFT_76470 [Dictyostelium purpureum]|eukprot:XP_003285545.1 hypothetical protein DICPUDRAFT_76470 [Dictyostelium purpureum]
MDEDLYINGRSVNTLRHYEIKKILARKGAQMERCPRKRPLYNRLVEILKKTGNENKIENKIKDTIETTSATIGEVIETTTTNRTLEKPYPSGNKILGSYSKKYNSNNHTPTRPVLNSSELTGPNNSSYDNNSKQLSVQNFNKIKAEVSIKEKRNSEIEKEEFEPEVESNQLEKKNYQENYNNNNTTIININNNNDQLKTLIIILLLFFIMFIMILIDNEK